MKILLIIPILLIAQEEKHIIGEEVIKGEAKKEITEIKIEVSPPIHPSEPIDTILSGERYIFDRKLLETIDRLNTPILYLHSEFLRVPLISKLFKGTIYLFIPSFEKTVSSWKLEITDSKGNPVRTLSGRGDPPPSIDWNGRLDNGKMVTTGELYNQVFTAYDAIGNPTRIPGARILWVRGIIYDDGRNHIVSVAGAEIFESGSALFRPGVEEYLDEMANEIKKNFKTEVVVYCYSQSEPLATQWCKKIKEEIVDRVVLPPDGIKIAPRFIPGLEAKYSKVELVIH
ncbi:MAG TPA: hypothetical protein EYP58_02635 [bacterium (Candidatus Stahlbacteria)]|nr:hypothetical protein [Candidatus Stahlbacteria bacterium]